MNFTQYLKNNENRNLSFLLLSHSDLDGYSPEILFEKALKEMKKEDRLYTVHMNAGKKLDIFINNCIQKKSFSSINNLHTRIGIDRNKLKEYGFNLSSPERRYGLQEIDSIFISIDCIVVTDLFPQDYSTLCILNDLQKQYNIKYFIFDHHISAYNVYNDKCDKYIKNDGQIILDVDFRTQNPYLKGRPCGTSLFSEAIIEYFGKNSTFSRNLYPYIELVRQWDTWDWKNLYPSNNPNLGPKKLNAIFSMTNKSEFVLKCILMDHPEELIMEGSEYESLLKYQDFLIQKSIRDAKTNGVRYTLDNGYKMLIIGSYNVPIGEVADGIFLDKAYSDIAVVMSINFNCVEFRSRNDNSIEFDCSKLAKELGGGGHAKASGAPILSHVISFSDGKSKIEFKIKK